MRHFELRLVQPGLRFVENMLLLDPHTLQPASEQRLLLHDVIWEEYERLSDAFINAYPRLNFVAISSSSDLASRK